MRRCLLVVTALIGIGLTWIRPAAAQDQSLTWVRWDVLIDSVDVSNNQFNVTESYNIQFEGTFRQGVAVIPLTDVDNIQNVQVSEDGQPLQSSCSETQGTFCVQRTGEGINIDYYFNRPIRNANGQFQIKYTVIGGLFIYTGGDQLVWTGVASDKYGFSVQNSTITVKMPPGSAPREGVDPVETFGAVADVKVNGTTITATAIHGVGADEFFKIAVQYPHVPGARVRASQAAYDQQDAYKQTTAPILNIGAIGLSLLIGLGGTLGAVTWWRTRGREPQVGPVPEYLSDPPSSLSPAVVGTLLDGSADLQDVISIIIDLARRGYIVLEEQQTDSMFGKKSTFIFKRTDKAANELRPYEQEMYNGLFNTRGFGGSVMERSMESLRNRFYTVIPRIQTNLSDALITEGLFATKPGTTRMIWGLLSGLMFAGAFVVYSILPSQGDYRYSTVFLCIPGALVALACVLIYGVIRVPPRTRKGAEEAAKWKAFKHYLQNLEKYTSVEEAGNRFDEFLPYAVAFGMDKIWIHKFSQLQNAPIPIWYYPTYMGGPYSRGYMPGTPLHGAGYGGMSSGSRPDDFVRAAGNAPSLNQAATNISGGLNSISTGLTTMLNSAGSAMTSRPQSTSTGSSGRWGGGGRGFSGGGFRGGGGGGRRGFK